MDDVSPLTKSIMEYTNLLLPSINAKFDALKSLLNESQLAEYESKLQESKKKQLDSSPELSDIQKEIIELLFK